MNISIGIHNVRAVAFDAPTSFYSTSQGATHWSRALDVTYTDHEGRVCQQSVTLYADREAALRAPARAALASPAAEPVQALTDDRIDHLWDTRVGDPTPKYPVNAYDVRLFARAIEAEVRALASPPATKAGWIPVSERLPESGVTVLACYTNRAGKTRRIRAQWVAAKSTESYPDSEIGEYDEAADTFYDPEGWYERIDNWCDYTSVAVCEGDITHWQPLPPAPEGAA